MLAYFLAGIMAFISLVLLSNGMISPKIHRQDDFLWSGLGLFYALVLWICAGRFTGAVLLGQLAGVAVTIAFMWENRQLRKVITAQSDSNTVLEGFSILSFVAESVAKISQGKKAPQTIPPESVAAKETPEVVASETSTSTMADSETSKQVKEEKEETETVIEQQEETVTTSETSSESEVKDAADEQVSKQTTEPETTPENAVQEEEEFLGSSLTSESKTKDNQNIFQRISGFFRKSKSEKQKIQSDDNKLKLDNSSSEKGLTELDSLNESEISNVEDFAENESISQIDPKTTATEVVEAIENLELPESENNLEDKPINDTEIQVITTSTEEETSPMEEVENSPSDVNNEVKTNSEDEIINDTQQIDTVEEEAPKTEKEDIPEDDIIESLSDLWPNPNETQSQSPQENENEETDSEIDSLGKLFEDDDKSKTDDN